MTADDLAGFTIGVTADRRAAEQIRLLAGRGAECVHGPTIKTHPIDTGRALCEATQALIADPPDIVVLTTGIGVRGWLEAADSLQLHDELRDMLSRAELCARGPKARGALATAGFEISAAPIATYEDIVAALTARGISGARVAVQLDGAGAGDLCDEIEARGANVAKIPVYRWSLPEDPTAAERLVRATVERRVDAVTFTAKPAVENFLEIAGHLSLADEVTDAFATGEVVPLCVGPVCATGLTDIGAPEPLVPARYRLGSMVQTLANHFAAIGHDLQLAGTSVRLQGRLAVIDGGHEAWLTRRERAILDILIERPGAVHSKRDLLRRVWTGDETDEHVVEVTVARLRQRLGAAAPGIETVVRRGYRVSAL